MRQSSGCAGSGSSATITGGSSAWAKRSADSGSASASARVQWRVTRQLTNPPRHGEGDQRSWWRGPTDVAEHHGGPPPSALRAGTSPFRGGSSLPLLLRQPLVEALGQAGGVIL